jgi:hypothetical protein
MVVELAGCIFSTTAVITNDDSMLWKVIGSLIMKAGICGREGGGHFEQL